MALAIEEITADTIWMVKNQIFIRVFTDLDLDADPTVYIEAKIRRADDDYIFTTLVGYPAADGAVVFYIDSVLKTLVIDDAIKSFTTSAAALSRANKIYVEFYEYENSGSLADTLSTSAVVILNAGVPKQHYDLIAVTNPLNAATVQKYFLTAREGKTIRMGLDQHGWWSIFNPDGTAIDVNVKYRIYLKNASVDYVDHTVDHTNIQPFHMKDVPIGNALLDLEQYIPAGSSITKYEVWTYKPTLSWDPYPYTIWIDEYRYKPRDFVFVNFLGGMEFLRCTGDIEMSVDVLNEIASQFEVYTAFNPSHVITRTKERYSEKVFIGWQQEYELGIVRDFLLSKSKYYADPELTRFIPLVVKSGSVVIGRKNESLHAIEFEIEYLVDNVVANSNFNIMQD